MCIITWIYVYYNMKTNRRDSYLLVYKLMCIGIDLWIFYWRKINAKINCCKYKQIVIPLLPASYKVNKIISFPTIL